jgi:lipoprotein LprG
MTLRRAAAAVSAAALLIITGCGSDSDDSSDDQSTSESTSESTEQVDEPAEPVAPGGVQLTLANFASTTSDAQVDAQSVHMEARGDMQGQSITMSGDMALGKTLEETSFALTMSAPSMGGDVSMMLVDGVMYLPEEPGSDKYMQIDLTDGSNPMGALFSQIFSQASPSATTLALEGAIEDFRPVGSEEIDGVMTTHYTVTVNTQKVLAETMGEELLSMAQSSGTALPETMTYDFWVGDDDNLPRRMRTDAMGMSMTIDFTAWGEPVDIQAPSEDQLSDKDPFGGMTMPTPTP